MTALQSARPAHHLQTILSFKPRFPVPAEIFRSLPNYAWCEMVCSLTNNNNNNTSGKSCTDTEPCTDLQSRSSPEAQPGENMSSLSDAHRRNSHLEGDRSSSAGSSLGSCSPPPASSHSPPPPRPPWLHDFHAAAAPHVLQFLNLSAAGGSMLASQPLAALHSMAERSHHQQHQQHQQQQQQQQQQQVHHQQQQQAAGIHLPRISVPLSTITQGQASPTGSGKHSPATSITSVGSNPHGIDTILSRPAATHPQAPVSATHAALQPTPHPQHMTAPRYGMHAGFTASSGEYFSLFSPVLIHFYFGLIFVRLIEFLRRSREVWNSLIHRYGGGSIGRRQYRVYRV